MTAAIDRVNRFMLVLLGLICLAGGVIALLIGVRVFGSKLASQTLLRSNERSFADRNAGWFYVVVAVVAVLIALLALRWLLAQARTQRVSSLNLEPDRSRGRTKLSTGALGDALEDECERMRGVSGASARMLGKPGDPLLRLDVKVSDDGDLGSIRSRIEKDAIPRARQAAGLPELPVWLRLQVATEMQRRQVS